MSPDEFCERLVALIEHERLASSRNLREIHARPVAERVEAGEAIAGLELRRSSAGRLLLDCPENLSRFREDDPLWLSDGHAIEDGCPVRFLDYDPVRHRLRIALDRGAVPPRRRRDLVLDRREFGTTDHAVEAVRALFSDASLRRARDLLLGVEPRHEVAAVAGSERARREGLDPVQAEAFVEACSSPCRLIQGPPGSGKTRLAGAVARAFLDAGHAVLVSAFTHRAVDNVLSAIAGRGDTAEKYPIYKVSRRENPHLDAQGVQTVPRAVDAPRARGPMVVGVTAHSAPRMTGGFELVLIDEAGQVNLAQACGLLPLGLRHVLIGDHRQLPPLLLDDHRDPVVGRSLFEHLDEAIGSRMLTRSYRLNDALCRIPSRRFYGGMLRPSDTARDRRLELGADVPRVLRPDPPLVVVEMAHRGARLIAPEEAEVAAAIAHRAVVSGLKASEIAVLAPHRAQGNRIRALLQRRLPDDPSAWPVVDTIDRLQGGERDLIVLSMTASDPQAVLAQAEFLFNPNRLNVALTRARRKLVVLMSEALLDAFPDDPSALDGTDLLRELWRDAPHLPWEE